MRGEELFFYLFLDKALVHLGQLAGTVQKPNRLFFILSSLDLNTAEEFIGLLLLFTLSAVKHELAMPGKCAIMAFGQEVGC